MIESENESGVWYWPAISESTASGRIWDYLTRDMYLQWTGPQPRGIIRRTLEAFRKKGKL